MAPYYAFQNNSDKRRFTTIHKASFYVLGADDEARTRYLHLGKVALYQMSYIRV